MENSEYIGRHAALDENGEPVMKESAEDYEGKHAAAENPWDELAENPPIFAGDTSGDEAETRRAQIDELAKSLDGAAALEFKQEASAQIDEKKDKIEETALAEDKAEAVNESPFGVPLTDKESNPETTDNGSEEEAAEKPDEEPEKEESERFLEQKEIDGILDSLQDLNRQIAQIDSVIRNSKGIQGDLDDLNHVRVRMIHESEAAIDDLGQTSRIAEAQEEYVRRMSRSCAEAMEICQSMRSKAAHLENDEDAEYAISKIKGISEQVEQIQGYLTSKMRNR